MELRQGGSIHSEKLFLFAGSYDQAREFTRRNKLACNAAVYLHSPDQLRGYARARILLIGSWRDREDFDDISRFSKQVPGVSILSVPFDEPYPSMLRCSRQDFIDCVNGDLLVRNREGVITHMGDRAWDAVCAAERGEKVILTVDGKDFSIISDLKETRIK